MALIGVLQTLVDGQIITAAQHNSNYSDIKTAFNTSAVLTDVAKTITVGHTWAAAQLFSGGITGPTTITKDNGAGLGTSSQLMLSSGVANHRGELHLTDGVTSDAFVSFLPNAVAANALLSFVYGATTLLSLTGAGLATFAGGAIIAGPLSGVSSLTVFGGQSSFDPLGWAITNAANTGRTATFGLTAPNIVLQTYDYAAAVYKAFLHDSLSYTWQLSGVNKLTISSTGILTLRNNANTASNLIIDDTGFVTLRNNVQMNNATGLFLGIGIGAGIFSSGGAHQLIAADKFAGWAVPTNTLLRTTFDTTTVTLPNLAARVGALIADLMGHGLIGA